MEILAIKFYYIEPSHKEFIDRIEKEANKIGIKNTLMQSFDNDEYESEILMMQIDCNKESHRQFADNTEAEAKKIGKDISIAWSLFQWENY